MRFTIPLMKGNGRRPQREPVPFQPMLPLELRNYVSGKGAKESGVCCIQEMGVMFACLKKHEFNEGMCSNEISSFQKCYQDTTAEKKVKRSMLDTDVLPTGVKKLHPKQLNKFLSKFPQQ